MKRFEMWSKNYHDRRYMEHLTEDEFKNRVEDICSNLFTISNDGKVSMPPVTDPDAALMMERFFHLSEECKYRKLPFDPLISHCIQRFLANTLSNSKLSTIIPRINSYPKNSTDFIYKYGKYEHILKSYNEGVFRIAPASSFSDSSLNSAIRDEELSFTFVPPPHEVLISFLDQNTREVKRTITPTEVAIKSETKVDYYVLCISSSLNPRSFMEFNYDSCLIIKDKNRFLNDVMNKFRSTNPDFFGFYRAVNYVDPLNCKINDIKIFADKHFRFAYQKEERFVWIPEGSVDSLQPVTLEIGPVAEYCDLICLNH